MAEAEPVEGGLPASTPSHDPPEPASVATLPAPSSDHGAEPELSMPPPPPAAPPAPEPSASVRGFPVWTFAVPADLRPGAGSNLGAVALPPDPPPPLPPPLTFGSRQAGSVAAVAAPALPSLGPAGERRHPALVVALAVVSLGVYPLAWHARVNRELSHFDARLEVSPGASTLPVALAWLAGLLCSLAGAAALLGHALQIGPVVIPLASGPTLHGITVTWPQLMLAGLLTVPYLVLLIPLSAVAVVMTLERVRVVQERVGMRPDGQIRPAARACLLLIPIIGGLWYLASVQSSLNRVWRSAPAPPPPPAPRRR